MTPPTEEMIADWCDALCAAIGWISAGTNEGNNATSGWTRERLRGLREYLSEVSGSDAP